MRLKGFETVKKQHKDNHQFDLVCKLNWLFTVIFNSRRLVALKRVIGLGSENTW